MANDPSVQAALTAPVAARGPALLRISEGQWFERKGRRVTAQNLARALVAFANAEGGTVVVGLADGSVEGVAAEPRHVNDLRQAALNLTVPPVQVRTTLLECLNDQGQPDQLLVFEVEVGQVMHATSGDDVYLRVGDESRKLAFSQRQELFYDKGQAQFEASPVPDATVADLDGDGVAQYAAAVGLSDSNRALAARGLVTRDGKVRLAAYLLFAPWPQDRFPETSVRVLAYRGTTALTGRDQNLVADHRLDGPIPSVIQAAAQAVRELQPKRRALGPDSRFIVEEVIPEDAWLEGIVNAVVHRSYSLGGDHIRVTLFQDRIEIESPGRLPGLVRPSDLGTGVHFARNPRIARACTDLGFGQELGEGIRRMFVEMKARGLADPLYKETSVSVRVTLSALARHPGLTRESLEILDVIRKGTNTSTGDVEEAIGLSRPAVLRQLYALRDAGLIERVGKSPKDPRAYWRLR